MFLLLDPLCTKFDWFLFLNIFVFVIKIFTSYLQQWQFSVTFVHLDNGSLILQRTNNTRRTHNISFSSWKVEFLKEIGDFWYFHIYSGLLSCDSLCQSASNYLNATEERNVFVKFYFYHDTSYCPLLWMFASVKSLSKTERGNQ